MASSMLRSAGIGNSNTGTTFLFHGTGNQLRVYFGIFSDSWYHASNKFSSWNESLLLSNKMIDFKYQTQQKNFHLTWESAFPTGAWALTAWTVFPRPVGVTIRGNLIGLPLLRVVNNSDRWMRTAWEWREASHVVRTRFGTRLSPTIPQSEQHNNFASYGV